MLSRERPEIVAARALHGALDAAEAAVVRRQHEVPVPVEHVVQRFQIAGGGDGGLLGIRPLVDVPVRLEPLLGRRRPHELPRAARARLGERIGLEPAFDHRDVGQIERQPLGAKHFVDHRQVLRAARQALLDIVAKPPLEKLDVGQHPIVLRNRHVVFRGREVRLDGFLGGGPGRRLRERRNREERVDGRGFGSLFREPVALGEGRHFVGVDPVDQPVEMFPEPGVASRPVGRFEEQFDRPVELGSCLLEVPELQLALAGEEMLLRSINQNGNGIGGWGFRRTTGSLGHWRWRRRRDLGLGIVRSTGRRECRDNY